jgi:hypothetical protein
MAQKGQEAEHLRAELDAVRKRLATALTRPVGSPLVGSPLVTDLDNRPGPAVETRGSKLPTELGPELAELLATTGLQQFSEGLAELGVTSPRDITYVTDEELAGIGLRPVQWRKLRTAAGVDAAPAVPHASSPRSPVVGSPAGRRSPTRAQSAREDFLFIARTQSTQQMMMGGAPAHASGSDMKSKREAQKVRTPRTPEEKKKTEGEKEVSEMKRALRAERLAREEAEQSLLAEREVMQEMKKMQVERTAERQRQHASATSAVSVVPGGANAETTHGAALKAIEGQKREHGTDTWRKLGQEIQSLESNIEYIENMLLPEDEEEGALMQTHEL